MNGLINRFAPVWHTLWLALALIALSACAANDAFATAPNIYKVPGFYPDANIPFSKRTPQARIFYVTDRMAVPGTPQDRQYSHARSASMALGHITASFGADMTWEQLKLVSAGHHRAGKVRLDLHSATEVVRFEPTPLPFIARNNRVTTSSAALKKYNAQTRVFKREIARQLRRSNRKEVTFFVHGFFNDFEYAGGTAANIWHYSGRVGVPVFYSWPGANPGIFGYFRDKESAEYSVYHLKETLRMLVAVPELKKLHIIAHSLGTELITTAVREIIIEERAAGRGPEKTLKIANLILAAPDLDFGVVTQRLIAERVGGPSTGQITVYMNPNDGMLALAQALASGKRLGRLSPDDLSAREHEMLGAVNNVNFINVERVIGKRDHSYFRKNPDVLSDIARLIQTGAAPGTAERPLERISGNFWGMHAGYPFTRPPEPVSVKDVVK
ncbi:MAG: alpha/beta hydrolase [Rhodobacteraceae bacterium]|nr:alpha/beta hydrolase [Paracoccaceae bacterium]